MDRWTYWTAPNNVRKAIKNWLYCFYSVSWSIERYRLKTFKWFKWDLASKLTSIHSNHLNALNHGLRMIENVRYSFFILIKGLLNHLNTLNGSNHCENSYQIWVYCFVFSQLLHWTVQVQSVQMFKIASIILYIYSIFEQQGVIWTVNLIERHLRC